MFIKVFIIRALAEAFAKESGGSITVRYDWDIMAGKMVEEYEVRY